VIDLPRNFGFEVVLPKKLPVLERMLPLGIIFLILGICLAVFNRQIAVAFSRPGGRRHIEELMYSVPRQNIAITGGAFVFGGLLMLYLA